MIATRTEQDAKDRFDLSTWQTECFGAVTAVGQHFALANCVANTHTVLALVRSDLRDERHATGHDLQQIAIERIDHGAEHRKWA